MEEIIISEEDLQVDPTHHANDESEIAAKHEVELRLEHERQVLEEARVELMLQAQEDIKEIRKTAEGYLAIP